LKKLLFLFIFSVLSANSAILSLGDSNKQYLCDEELKHPMGLENCNIIKAIDEINICYFKNMRLGCKKILKDEVYNMEKIDSNGLNFKRLLSFHNNNKTSFGIKRFGEKLEEIGMPNGSILKPNRDIVVKLDKKYKLNIKLINGKKIYEYKANSDSIILKSKYLKYGNKYTWEISIDDKEYMGKFDIFEKTLEKQIEKEISEVGKNLSDKNSIIYVRSIIYDQYGLSYDRKKILEEGVQK